MLVLGRNLNESIIISGEVDQKLIVKFTGYSKPDHCVILTVLDMGCNVVNRLVLSESASAEICQGVRVSLLRWRFGVRLGISAPRNVRVDREEIYYKKDYRV